MRSKTQSRTVRWIGMLFLAGGAMSMLACGPSYEGDYQGQLTVKGTITAQGKEVKVAQNDPVAVVKVTKSGDGYKIEAPKCTIEATKDEAGMKVKEGQTCTTNVSGANLNVAMSGVATVKENQLTMNLKGVVSGGATGDIAWSFVGTHP